MHAWTMGNFLYNLKYFWGGGEGFVEVCASKHMNVVLDRG